MLKSPIVNADELAPLLNISTRRISQLVLQDGMPRGERGKYDLHKCVTWYIRHLQIELRRRGANVLNPEGGDVDSLRAERERLTKAQADHKELELAVARGTMIPLPVYEERVKQVFMVVRQRVLTLKHIAPQLEGEPRQVIAEKIDTAARATLTGLATNGNGNGND
jgi:phage terminase Nu1 subunit (DNA packaging protein)